MATNITTEIYIAPTDQKYAFVPTTTDVFMKGLLKQQIERPEHATFDYDAARAALQALEPKTPLQVRSPVVAVFQGQYGDSLPGILSFDDFVAVLHGYEDKDRQMALAVELDMAFGSSAGVDVMGDIGRLVSTNKRITIRPMSEYNPDPSGKISEYNGIAEFCERTMGKAYISDGQLIPRRVADRVISRTHGLPKDASFQERWNEVKGWADYDSDGELAKRLNRMYQGEEEESQGAFEDNRRIEYALERKRFAQRIQDPQYIQTELDSQMNLNAINVMSIVGHLGRLRAEHGLTSNESGLYNGLKLVEPTYREAMATLGLEQVLGSESIVTPEDISRALAPLTMRL